MSRAGILGAAVGLLAFVAVSRNRIQRGRGMVWMQQSGSAAWSLIGLLFANFGALAMRLQETTESGEWGRRAIWRDTWRMTQDFWLTGVGAGAFERGMLVYQEGSRHVLLQPRARRIPAAGRRRRAAARRAGRDRRRSPACSSSPARLRGDRTPIFWIRAGAVAGMIAVAVQSVWDTGLRTPANGVLFAIVAAIACHETRESRR